MKKAMILGAVLLAFSASAANAAGIAFAWHECAQSPPPPDGPGDATNWNFNCLSNNDATTPQGSPPYALVPSFDPTSTVVFAGNTIIVDIQAGGGTLPNWWRVETGGCRQLTMAVVDPAASGTFGLCANPYNGTGSLANFLYGTGSQVGFIAPATNAGPDRARIFAELSFGGAVNPTLNPGTKYYAPVLTLSQAKSFGFGNCAGCLTPVSLMLNKIVVYARAGSGTSDLHMESPDSPEVQCITWQGGVPGTCAGATPVKSATWGSIKALYR